MNTGTKALAGELRHLEQEMREEAAAFTPPSTVATAILERYADKMLGIIKRHKLCPKPKAPQKATSQAS